MPKQVGRIVCVLQRGQPLIIDPICRTEQRPIAIRFLANVVHIHATRRIRPDDRRDTERRYEKRFECFSR